MIAKFLRLCGLAGLLSLFAAPAMANIIQTATATFSCGPPASFVAAFTGADLSSTDQYEVDFTVNFSGGGTFSSSVLVPAGTSGNFSVSFSNTGGTLTGTFTLSGSATLRDDTANTNENTIPISFTNPNSQVTCPQTPPICTAASSNPSNFNGTQINAGSFIWFNANFKASGIPSSGATLSFTNSTISLNGTTYSVPNAQITFTPTASCASVTFDAGTNTWISTIPTSGNVDDIFFDGLALPVTSTLAHIQNPVVWNGTFSTSTPGVSVQWKWGAAVYTQFTTAYNSLNVKPTHQNACGLNNGDQAGTPENIQYRSFVVGGARGGGGSNFTGSWSGTANANLVCPQ